MLNAPNADFVPGRSIDVNIMVQSFDDVLSIPRSALHKDGKTWFAYRIDGDLISASVVTFVDWPGSSVVLTSGLTAGAIIALDAAAALGVIAEEQRASASVVSP